MTTNDRAKYVRTCTMCEFMTGVASAMEFSGGLNQNLSDRVENIIEPVREARDWMWRVGQLMAFSRPLPSGFHETLERSEDRALEALPRFKALMDEACEELAHAAQGSTPEARGGQRPKLVRLDLN